MFYEAHSGHWTEEHIGHQEWKYEPSKRLMQDAGRRQWLWGVGGEAVGEAALLLEFAVQLGWAL